jgi:hypothetical protein
MWAGIVLRDGKCAKAPGDKLSIKPRNIARLFHFEGGPGPAGFLKINMVLTGPFSVYNPRIMTCQKSVLYVWVFALLFPCAVSCAAAEPVIAIDILLEPDATMADHARGENARLLKDHPQGFVLDATHAPHITVLQCFIAGSDLGKVFDAVSQVARAQKPVGMELTAKGYYYMPWEGLGLAGITIERTTELLKYQKAVIEAVRPFIRSGGGADAFYPNEDGTPVGGTTVDDIEHYIASHSGVRYNPHVTIGLAHEAFLREMIAAPFTPFTFKVRDAAIYHLGNCGTARQRLWSAASDAAFAEREKDVLLVRDFPPAGALPDNFRTMDMIAASLKNSKSPVPTAGLETLRASGSAEPWEKAFPALKERLGDDLVIVDLRQESHGFLNGAPVAWFLPPADWINLGKSHGEALWDEKGRLAKLAGEKTVLTHDDEWIPSHTGTPGQPEQVLSVASEEELALRNGIRYVRFTVPDHMHPSDEDVDRFVALIRGLGEKDRLHFHCHAGMGRTTTFLAMYDMLMNAGSVSLQDIVARQAAAGPRYDLFSSESGPPFTELFRERKAFLKRFYEYAKAFREDPALSWTEWNQRSGKAS